MLNPARAQRHHHVTSPASAAAVDAAINGGDVTIALDARVVHATALVIAARIQEYTASQPDYVINCNSKQYVIVFKEAK